MKEPVDEVTAKIIEIHNRPNPRRGMYMVGDFTYLRTGFRPNIFQWIEKKDEQQ